MDLNLVVISGALACKPEVTYLENGTTVTKLLVTTRSEPPNRRLDVIPIVIWGEDHYADIASFEEGTRVWVSGSVQRRFWQSGTTGRSRIEIVATDVIKQRDRSDTTYTEMMESHL